MKRIYLMLLAIVAILGVSCSNDDEPQIITNTDFVAESNILEGEYWDFSDEAYTMSINDAGEKTYDSYKNIFHFDEDVLANVKLSSYQFIPKDATSGAVIEYFRDIDTKAYIFEYNYVINKETKTITFDAQEKIPYAYENGVCHAIYQIMSVTNSSIVLDSKDKNYSNKIIRYVAHRADMPRTFTKDNITNAGTYEDYYKHYHMFEAQE